MTALATLLSALAGFLAGVIRGLVADWFQRQALKDLGRAEASSDTLIIIAEKAHAQAEVNATDRGGAGDVARRLRERLAQPRAH